MIRPVAAAVLLAALAGCAPSTSTFEIVDYRKAGSVERYHEVFDEGYFDIDAQGNVDIVLRRGDPSSSSAGQGITQIVHIRTVWRTIPGTTVAHKTQLNATVGYHIVAGQTGAAFEGAGSVFFNLNDAKDALNGTLSQALLRPRQRFPADAALFERAELEGRFLATRDPRRVVRIVNEMNRLFRPPPNRP